MTLLVRARATGALAVAALVVAGTAFAPSAAADGSFEDTQWYFTHFNMAANHAKASGQGVTVAVIDGGPINPSVPELAGAAIVTQPQSACLLADGTPAPAVATDAESSHSTSIAVMLLGNGKGNFEGRGGSGVAPGITLRHYRVGVNSDPSNTSQFDCLDAAGQSQNDIAASDAIDDAVAAGARVVSMSFTGRVTQSNTAEAIGRAESKGVVVVAGTADKADDGSGDARVSPPSSFNGVLAVNGIKADSSLSEYSADSTLVAVAAPGTNLGLGAVNPATGQWDSSGYVNGSSYATPFVAGVIADAMSAYPQATSNQILQLLFRTTGGQLHDLPTRDTGGLGYGVPSLTSMLENDPSQFPDENPLLRDGAEPPTSEIVGGTTGGASTSAAPSTPDTGSAPSSTTPDRAVDQGDTGSSFPWWLVAVVVVVLLVAALVGVLLVRRRGRTGPPSAPPPVPYVHT